MSSLSPQPSKPRVLVVDDSAANRLALEAVLDREYAVSTAESGTQALELCRKEEFAVIVLDVRMPGLNGFETAQALRKLEATRSTPIIIFTTAYEQTVEQVTRGFAAGATDFLFSPVEPEILKLKVATYVRIYLQHEALRLKVQELTAALADLHAELARHGLTLPGLKSKLDKVEKTASDIDRQTQ
ncbi:MAG TPA: response regulator [Planctomycetota bacterium]